MKMRNLSYLLFLGHVLAPGTTAAEPLPDRFNFPTNVVDKTVTTKAEGTEAKRPEPFKARMVVDGVLTDAIWPEQAPTVYPIGKDRFLLHDSYAELGDYVWNRTTKKLTPLGRSFVFHAGTFGLMVVRYPENGKEVEIVDFPDETGKPRVLWHKQRDSGHLPPLGAWDGALVCVLGQKRLLVLHPGQEAKELTVDLGDYRWQPSAGDAIRRGKVLVLGPLPPNLRFSGRAAFKVSVGVLDLKTKQVKYIGKINGGWTTWTAIPHPSASAWWITQAEAKKLGEGKKLPPFVGFDGGSARVTEETEQIVQPEDKEERKKPRLK